MSAKTLLLGFVILLLLLNHTHGYAKLWGSSRVHELNDVHKNVHIHVHTLPEDHYHHQQPYVEAWQSSPANAYHVWKKKKRAIQPKIIIFFFSLQISTTEREILILNKPNHSRGFWREFVTYLLKREV